MRVGFVKQNISFAGEALEQVGDGRGWWHPKRSDTTFLDFDFRLWAHSWPNCLRETPKIGRGELISVASLCIYYLTNLKTKINKRGDCYFCFVFYFTFESERKEKLQIKLKFGWFIILIFEAFSSTRVIQGQVPLIGEPGSPLYWFTLIHI